MQHTKTVDAQTMRLAEIFAALKLIVILLEGQGPSSVRFHGSLASHTVMGSLMGTLQSFDPFCEAQHLYLASNNQH